MILVGVGIISTGLPAAFVLIAVGQPRRGARLATGTIPFSLLWALPGRLINLFDNDLLQALPLYVTMGLLLGRLPVADALYRTSNAVLPKRASAPLVSGMLLGALLGPMNGSVGASVLGLSRVVAPRLDRRRRAGGDARRRRRGRRDARRPGAALAGAHPAQRRDAQRAHLRGDRDRPQRPRHQHAGHLSRRACCRPEFFWCCASRWPGSPAAATRCRRRANGSTPRARRSLPAFALAALAGAARRRRHRLFLRGRSGGDGRLHVAERRPDQRAAARRGAARTAARRHRHHRRAVLAADRGHHVHAGAAAARHRPAGRTIWSPPFPAATFRRRRSSSP